MRNLKRALSLALAFVMVMGLMIVGTSAKSYTDADKIDNQVAVEILGEIGVMIGNDDGSFAPDRDVTRAEMAVLITRILYGNNLNVDQFKDMNTFTDVPDWAEGFVNLCASLDIIAGRGNGIFDPDATVTSAEAALMLSRALGFQEQCRVRQRLGSGCYEARHPGRHHRRRHGPAGQRWSGP